MLASLAEENIDYFPHLCTSRYNFNDLKARAEYIICAALTMTPS